MERKIGIATSPTVLSQCFAFGLYNEDLCVRTLQNLNDRYPEVLELKCQQKGLPGVAALLITGITLYSIGSNQ